MKPSQIIFNGACAAGRVHTRSAWTPSAANQQCRGHNCDVLPAGLDMLRTVEIVMGDGDRDGDGDGDGNGDGDGDGRL